MVLLRAHDPFSGHAPDAPAGIPVWPVSEAGKVSGPPVTIPDDPPPDVGTTVPGDSAERVQAALESMGEPVDTEPVPTQPQTPTEPVKPETPQRGRRSTAKRTRAKRAPRRA